MVKQLAAKATPPWRWNHEEDSEGSVHWDSDHASPFHGTNFAGGTSANPPIRPWPMCRYGMTCWRPGCRYTHHNEAQRCSSMLACWSAQADRDTRGDPGGGVAKKPPSNHADDAKNDVHLATHSLLVEMREQLAAVQRQLTNLGSMMQTKGACAEDNHTICRSTAAGESVATDLAAKAVAPAPLDLAQSAAFGEAKRTPAPAATEVSDDSAALQESNDGGHGHNATRDPVGDGSCLNDDCEEESHAASEAAQEITDGSTAAGDAKLLTPLPQPAPTGPAAEDTLPIFVEPAHGDSVVLHVKASYTVAAVKAMLMSSTEPAAIGAMQLIGPYRQVLDDRSRLKDHGIGVGSTIYMPQRGIETMRVGAATAELMVAAGALPTAASEG